MDRSKRLTTEQVRKGLKNSTMDAMSYAVMAALTSGVFLTAFALALGATDFQIGLIASLPLLAGIAQLPASYLMERNGSLKRIAVLGSTLSRSLLIIIILVPIISYVNKDYSMILTLLILLFLHYTLASISSVAWLSWMSRLVPEEIYGRYFGFRNMIIGGTTMIATLLAGKLMGLYSPYFGEKNLLGFIPLFLVALFFGFLSLRFLKAVPEVDVATEHNDMPSMTDYLQPLSDTNFRWLILFSLSWKFGVNAASPYIVVYMLQDLHLSYGEVAFLSAANTFTNIAGMWVWGKFSDRFGNRPVMMVTGWGAAIIPLLWIFTYNFGFKLALPLHMMAGFFWAAINLSEVNILLKLAPKGRNSIFIGTFSAVTNLFAALGAIVGGLLATLFVTWKINLYFLVLSHFHFLFLVSFIIRLSSLRLLRYVQEPKEKAIAEMIKVLTNPRNLSTVLGFNLIFNKSLFKE